MPLPNFTKGGDLPVGIYKAGLAEVLSHFGTNSLQRRQISERLKQIYKLAMDTGKVARFILFGSYVTDKPDPRDVDVFLLMEDDFKVDQVKGEAKWLFYHLQAQTIFGASVFWLRRASALGGEQAAIED